MRFIVESTVSLILGEHYIELTRAQSSDQPTSPNNHGQPCQQKLWRRVQRLVIRAPSQSQLPSLLELIVHSVVATGKQLCLSPAINMFAIAPLGAYGPILLLNLATSSSCNFT
jgi:hypothetical protein